MKVQVFDGEGIPPVRKGQEWEVDRFFGDDHGINLYGVNEPSDKMLRQLQECLAKYGEAVIDAHVYRCRMRKVDMFEDRAITEMFRTVDGSLQSINWSIGWVLV